MFQSERENKDFAFNFSNFFLHNASKAFSCWIWNKNDMITTLLRIPCVLGKIILDSFDCVI